MMTPDINRPIPAAIDGRTWTVADSPNGSGGTDTRRADMYAPLNSTPTARMIRNHELIHARITPRTGAHDAAKKHGVSIDAMQWSEDYRVGLLQSKLRLVDREAFDASEAATFAKNIAGNPRMVAGALLATRSTPFQCARIVAALVAAGWTDDAIGDTLTGVDEIIAAAYPAKRGAGRRPRGGGTKFKPAGFTRYTVPLALAFDARFPEAGPPGAGGERMDDETRRAGQRVQRIRGAGRWGVIERIVKAPMSRTVRPRRPVGRRFSDAGVIPSAVHRLPVDGSIFSTRRRARGGTILCDASGSMNYDDADIERIISNAPAATIAFYSGYRGEGGYKGRIVIASHRGKAASVAEVRKALKGGNNYIDGPALRWLAKQPGPRVWVSDEDVGGAGGDFGRGGTCHAECRMICAAGAIKIVPNIDAVR